MKRKRVGVLISGRGSNLAAMMEAARDHSYPAEIALVISNRPDAPGLLRAREARVATATVDHHDHSGKEAFDRAVDQCLEAHHIDLVACAGYMRIMTAALVEKWRDRMINIHPSLLPAYRGLNTHERALADGVRIHGATVHFIRHEVDSGPIIAQAAVPVMSSDTPASLAARVLDAEHKLYPIALALVASGKIRVDGDRTIATDAPSPEAPLIVPKL